MRKLILFLCTAGIMSAVHAQVEAPQPSPFTKIEQKVGLTDVTLEYSRPGARDREIFGELVPFDKVWRTGANENTKISFSDEVTIQGQKLKAGTYAIYTIPNENQWEVIFYSDASNWGNPEEWDEEKVALKATAQVDQLPFEMETFTIMIDDLKRDSAALNFVWDNTVASLRFEVPTEKKAMASIEKVMNGPGAGDYFAAATYYHDANKDLEKAYTWINKALEMGNPNAYWILRRKSLIAADLDKKEEAIATAKKSLTAAEKAGNQDYVKMNKDSLKEWGAM
jgi:tetratricopeptide (TPR) repeat protein